MTINHDIHESTPPELRGIEGALDRLVKHETASASVGFEDRVHVATWGVMVAASPLQEPKFVAEVPPAAFRLFTRVRVAAGFALAGTAAAVWLAGMHTNATNPTMLTARASAAARYDALDAKVESLLAWSSPMGDGFGGLGEQIDLLYADLSGLNLGGDDWTTTGLWLDGSSM
jgi:hypothetical protein